MIPKTNLDFHSVVIKGERVMLRPVSMDDAEDIFREFTPEITRYMVPTSPDDIQQIRLFIDLSNKGMTNKEDLVLSITRTSNEEFLGVCGLHGKKSPDTPELGIWLKKSAHGESLGREAITNLAAWAQSNLSYNYLLYPVDRDNIASRKIAEHLGGEIFHEKTRKSMSGKVLNEIAYKITWLDGTH